MNQDPAHQADEGRRRRDDDDFTVHDVVARLRGWTAASIHPLEEITEIRLRGKVGESPDWVTARAVLYSKGAPPEPLDPSQAVLTASEGVVNIGAWAIPAEEILAAQMLDSAIVTVPAPVAEPVASPTAAVERILASGTLVWPPVADLEPRWRGLELLAGVTRQALTAPSLIVSITEDDHGTGRRRWDVFVTPDAAVETQVPPPDATEVMAVAWFPIGDVVSRVLERAGLTGLVLPAGGATRQVEVRSTFLTDESLTVGALAWTAGAGPELLTEDGARTPAAMTAEVLGLLPHAGKEVVRIE